MVLSNQAGALCQEQASARNWVQNELPCEAELPLRSVQPVSQWPTLLPVLLSNLTTSLLSRWRETARLEGLEREVQLLKRRLADLEEKRPVCVPVQSLSPEPYKVTRPFSVLVQASGDEYIATFFDANLSASGETQEEAVRNLKDIIVIVFESLTEHDDKQLGIGPARQLKVLGQFLRRCS